MAPSAQTIGFLINATNPYVELDVQDVAAASNRLRRKLVVLRVATRNDLEQTFATVEDRGVSALIRASDPFLCGQRDQVIALANQIGIPKPLKIKRMNALMFGVSIEALSAGRDLMTWRWRRLKIFRNEVENFKEVDAAELFSPAFGLQVECKSIFLYGKSGRVRFYDR